MEIRIYVYILIVYLVIVLGYAKSVSDRISNLQEINTELRSELLFQEERYRVLQRDNAYHDRKRREGT